MGGASVVDRTGLLLTATKFAYNKEGDDGGFAALVADLAMLPPWIAYSSSSQCVADRSADPRLVEVAINWACNESFVCQQMPSECSSHLYLKGDYARHAMAPEAREGRN